MMRILAKFSPRSFDWTLSLVAILLVALGLAAIYSVDLSRGSALIYFRKQLLSAGIGLGGLLLASITQFTFFRSYAKLFFLGSVALLVAVLIFGVNIRGTRGWFALGSFSFQPVEVAKIGIIFMLAYIVYNFGRRFERPLFFFGTGLVTFLIMALVMMQPDLGSAVIIGTIWFGIMFLVGARTRYIVGLIIAGMAFCVVAWFFLLQPYQKERVLTFVYPERDSLGAGYNSTQALIAVGAGQWWGRGLARGSQSQLRFLPEAQTDFIFSVIAEELGFVGNVVFLILFSLMLWRLIKIAQESQDDFVSVTMHGIAILFFAQLLVNVGANIGLLPITGVTLPFVSYGGSSLIVNLSLIGVAEAMVKKRY